MKSIQRKWLIAIYFMSVLLVGFLTSIAIDFPVRYRLSHQSEKAVAVISDVKCDQHMLVAYAFSVRGRQYAGSGAHIACRQSAVGGGVTVRYLPEDPTINAIDDEGSFIADDLLAIMLSAILLPLLIVFGVWSVFRRHGGSSGPA